MLKGSISMLRPIDLQGDPRRVQEWFCDSEVTKHMIYGQRPQTIGSVSDWLKCDTNSPINDVFIICSKDDSKPIGLAGLYSVSQTAQNAELRILIGNRDYWNQGYGTDVVELLLFYAFDRLNLNSIWLGVGDINKTAIRLYEKCGFSNNGRRRAAVYRNGKYQDVVCMDILRSEYEAKYYDKHRSIFEI